MSEVRGECGGGGGECGGGVRGAVRTRGVGGGEIGEGID